MNKLQIMFHTGKYRIILHLLFWTAYLLFYTFQYGLFRNEFLSTFKNGLLSLPVIMSATYFNIYILLPNYLLKRKYWWFSLLFISTVFLFTLLFRLESYYIIIPASLSEDIVKQYQQISIFNPAYFFSHFVNIYTVVIAAACIKILKQWYKNEQENQLLKNDKLEAELKFLKAQIHPHFLFNTLNNLLALTIKKSDKAPETVIKLSELLDYMLYKCDSPLIELSKEIKLIKDYISLEKLRYSNRLDIELKVSGESSDKVIAPLILLPFVENSFKHGVSNDSGTPWIKIKIIIDIKRIAMKVSNSFTTHENNVSDYKEGIGINNVKRRLELLYPNKHNLIIEENNNSYNVDLNLEID